MLFLTGTITKFVSTKPAVWNNQDTVYCRRRFIFVIQGICTCPLPLLTDHNFVDGIFAILLIFSIPYGPNIFGNMK